MSKEPDTILEPFLSGNDIRINEGGEEVVDTTENKNSGSDEKLTAEDGGDQGDNGINNIFNSELKSSSSLPTESITNTSTKDQVDDDESNKNNPIKFSSMVDDQKPVSPSSNIRRNSSSQFNPTTSTVPISQDEIYFQPSIDSKAKAINESSNQPVQMPSTSNLSSRQTPDKDTLTKQDSQCQTSSPSPTKNPNAPYIRHQNRLSPNQSIQSQSNKTAAIILIKDLIIPTLAPEAIQLG
ncbi:hypothetical protein PPACK8108_LOCUS24640 [Phakopsora pachyrhizi]|uniref:Uncharacterized protein n=1 Tax=Phakopsora pachyrhizi TaxID=170000 RepID=A0AAV0BTC4_PHAPC|nr:hypothetical protein PPACK8108_LOCUS24640 [Phakopsora pachyrhizi]